MIQRISHAQSIPLLARRRFAAAACFLALFLLSLPGQIFSEEARRSARVLAINDGDTVTLKMAGGTYRTRLIGMDAPEMGQEPWGRKARQHLAGLIKDSGGIVGVETDVVRQDKYDRLLVYLWSSRGALINEGMIRDGYAVLFTIRPNTRYAERFRTAQRIARKESLGIWGPDGLKKRPLEYKKAHPRTIRSRSGRPARTVPRTP